MERYICHTTWFEIVFSRDKRGKYQLHRGPKYTKRVSCAKRQSHTPDRIRALSKSHIPTIPFTCCDQIGSTFMLKVRRTNLSNYKQLWHLQMKNRPQWYGNSAFNIVSKSKSTSNYTSHPRKCSQNGRLKIGVTGVEAYQVLFYDSRKTCNGQACKHGFLRDDCC